MASLYISYFGSVQHGVAADPVKSEVVTTSGTSAQSGVIPGGIVAVLRSDAAHYVAIGADPTAAEGAGSFYAPANADFAVRVMQGQKLAAVTA